MTTYSSVSSGRSLKIRIAAKDLFSENLKYLRQTNKILADRLEKSLSISQRVEIVSSKSGAPTAKVKGILLHSLYDPFAEAKRMLDSYELKGRELVIIFGFGLGYHTIEAAKRIDQKTRLLIIEPQLNIFRQALKRMDLSSLLGNEDVRFSVGDDLQDIIELLNDEEILSARHLLIEHPASAKLSQRHLWYVRLLLSGREAHQKKREGIKLSEDDLIQLLIEGMLFKNWPNRKIRVRNILTFPGRVYKRILLIQLASIGDVVYTTPVFSGLKERFKDAELYFLTEDQNCELVADDPHIDGVFAFDKEGFLQGLFGSDGIDRTKIHLKEFVRRLRDKGFDLVINLHTSPRSAALTKLVACENTWGLTLDDQGLPCVLGHPWVHYRYWTMREGSSGLGIVELHLLMANVDPSQRETHIYVDGPSREKTDRLLESLNIKDGFIGLFPGSNYPSRRWPKENFAGLGDLIQSIYGTRIIIFGGQNDRDLADWISRSMKVTPTNLAGKTSLRELAGLLERASLLITNDSGPLHIACAVKTPTITLTGPAWIGPYGPGHLVLVARLPCIGCPKFVCDEHTCMEMITPQGVIAGIEILNELRKGVRDEARLKGLLNSPALRETEILYSGDRPPGKLFSLVSLIKAEVGLKAAKEAITRFASLNLWGMEDQPYISPDEIVERVRQDLLIEDSSGIIRELAKVHQFLKELYSEDRPRSRGGLSQIGHEMNDLPLLRAIEYLTSVPGSQDDPLQQGRSYELRKRTLAKVIETIDGVIELISKEEGQAG